MNDFKVKKPQEEVLGDDMLVANFMIHNSKWWDVDKLRRWMSEEEVQAISAIHIPNSGANDSLIRPHESSESYTVKFGYVQMKVRQMLVNDTATSSNQAVESLYGCFIDL